MTLEEENKLLRDHPRLRGEKLGHDLAQLAPHGSPPLARGKAVTPFERRVQARITPACAGKSKPLLYPDYTPWDHPRLRGEKLRRERAQEFIKGSPPLARGKAHTRAVGTDVCRITPACAGKSRTDHIVELMSKDHPRLRGEKDTPNRSELHVIGSPPLARGKEYC